MLYTIGYTGTKIDDLVAFVHSTNAILCDIRFSPTSRNPVYTKKQLQARFDERYFHLGSLGNRNYRGGPIDIVDYAKGMRTIEGLLVHWPAAVILCVCADVTTCHRKGVGEKLSQDLHMRLEHVSLSRKTAQQAMLL